MGMTIKALSLTQQKGTPWENRVLNGIDLQIRDGESIGMIGPSGSGKTMLLKVLSSLIMPTTGTVRFDSQGFCGIVFQEPHRGFFASSVWDEVAYGPKNLRLKPDLIEKRVRSSFETVGLAKELWTKSPFHLSGGEQRRLAIASALAMGADTLLLDEPTTGLDGTGQENLIELLRQLNTVRTTLLVVSHDMDFLFKFTNRVLLMARGRIIKDLSWDELSNEKQCLIENGMELPTSLSVLKELEKRGMNLDRKLGGEQDVIAALRAFRRVEDRL